MPKYPFPQSARLRFRSWIKADSLPFAALNADPEVRAHFPSVLTKEESDRGIRRFQEIYEEAGYTFYAVEVAETQDFIGFIGLIPLDIEVNFASGIEIGWRLKRSAWGQGYATEGAKACLELAFSELKAPEIYSFTATSNRRSERVMQRIGMKHTGEFDHPKLTPGHPLERHVLYRITSEEFSHS
ncbi:MAG: GNAT family N-acetyltransferase [Bacteroidota bacterium]